MSEHTPGPWESFRLRDGNYKGLYVKQSGDKGLFLVRHTFDGMQAEANMKLMAAAPDMYEALEKALIFITNGTELGYIKMPDLDSEDSALNIPNIIRKALTKAQDGGW